MNRFKKFVYVALISGLFSALWTATEPSIAHARASVDLPYPVEQIWSSSVRFLRVDRRFPILEKDKEAGYILFDYVEEGTKVHKASLELVAIVEATGRSATRVVVSIPDKPRHVESLLLEKLGGKAKDDLGAPAPPPSKAKPKDPEGEGKRKEDGGKSPAKPEPDDDPNRPVRGEDGLPRLPERRDFPRPPQ